MKEKHSIRRTLQNKMKRGLNWISRTCNSNHYEMKLLSLRHKINNPYLSARLEWQFMFHDFIKAKRNWQIISLLLVIPNILLLSGFLYLSTQSKYVPYVLKVDGLGNTRFSGKLMAGKGVTPLQTNAFIRRYIISSRSVIADPIAQKHELDYVYSLSTLSVKKVIDGYYKIHNPFRIFKDHTIEVKVNAVLQQSDTTWQVNWVEINRSLDGNILGSSHWEAIITVAHYEVNDIKMLTVNPLSLFVTHLSWSQQF